MKVFIIGTIFLGLILAKEYKVSCDCGYAISKKVVGGQDSKMNSHPWMAAVLEKANHNLLCGGTVITQWHILSGTQPLFYYEHIKDSKFLPREYQPDELLVCVGVEDVTKCKINEIGDLYEVYAIKRHREYSTVLMFHDISILTTKTEIFLTKIVKPACLPIKKLHDDLDKEILKGLGWGNEDNVDILQEINFSVVPHHECHDLIPSLHEFKVQTCTKSISESGSLCELDVGGPVLWFDPDINRYTVVGVLSYASEHCHHTSLPFVNTDVSAYLEWINRQIKGSSNPLNEVKRKGILCTKV